jgi:glycine cleavage system T protein (aminomethyltransferase)
MQKTELYQAHKRLGAKFIEFADWDLPVEYSGSRKESIAVRTSAGLFDVSHMGEIEITGRDSASFCQWITTNDIGKLRNFQAQYTILCNHQGGVIDDVIIYKYSDEYFLMCVNAANTVKDFEWIGSIEGEFRVEVLNRSFEYSQLALQGPKSQNIIGDAFGFDLCNLKRFYFRKIVWNDIDLLVARTGYTGEDGFEIFIPLGEATRVWEVILDTGSDYVILPSGLSARDILRIEMAYPLYGHEISEDINPIESGLSRYVRIDKGDFIGKTALVRVLETGPKKTLIGFEMIDRGIPREGYPVLRGEVQLGTVTSGTLSPSLKKSVGMALLNTGAMVGEILDIEIRGTRRKSRIVSTPFYTNKPLKKETSQ